MKRFAVCQQKKPQAFSSPRQRPTTHINTPEPPRTKNVLFATGLFELGSLFARTLFSSLSWQTTTPWHPARKHRRAMQDLVITIVSFTTPYYNCLCQTMFSYWTRLLMTAPSMCNQFDCL